MKLSKSNDPGHEFKRLVQMNLGFFLLILFFNIELI